MNIENPASITIDKFQKRMREIKGNSLEPRAQAIANYFEATVFGKKQWGDLLKSLRDKITHREKLWPSNQGDEVIFDILLDWPTINGMSFDHFTQIFANGMFEMLRETTPILFELEWKSGPDRDDLWS